MENRLSDLELIVEQLSDTATYKGRLIRDMGREELLELIVEQLLEYRKCLRYVDWSRFCDKNEVIDVE
jgi:hypothetical protein